MPSVSPRTALVTKTPAARSVIPAPRSHPAPSSLGNQAMLRRLRASGPAERLEAEADQVADAAMDVDRGTAGAGRAVVGRVPAGAARAATPPEAVRRVLQSPGRPLYAATRAAMEPRLGADLSGVSVLVGSDAAEANHAIGARAFTAGARVAFGEGQYQPASPAGRRLLAHELTHVVQQRGGPAVIQREPKVPGKPDPFDFTTVDVDGKAQVIGLNPSTSTAEFLDAFEASGEELIKAELAWTSDNMVDVTRDGVLSEKRDALANLNVDMVRGIAAKSYQKAVGALFAKGVSTGVGKLFSLVHFGKKVLMVGEEAGTLASRFGGILAMVGAAVVQFLIGPLFDKSKELVSQAVHAFADQIKAFENQVIIPEAMDTAKRFAAFMQALRGYLLQDEVDASEPMDKKSQGKDKPKAKGGATNVTIGKGDFALTFALDQSLPLTDRREQDILIELANDVLAIKQVLPVLAADKSFYREMTLRAGVFSGKEAIATPAEVGGADKTSEPKKPAGVGGALDMPFKFKVTLPGAARFEVAQGGGVKLASEAHYPSGLETADQPKTYRASLYKVSTSSIKHRGDQPATDHHFLMRVDKTDVAEWYNLDAGTYYVVLEKDGSPAIDLEGRMGVQVLGHAAQAKP